LLGLAEFDSDQCGPSHKLLSCNRDGKARRSSLFNLRKLEAARLGGLFLVDADLLT
jgi:hypothetical protein